MGGSKPKKKDGTRGGMIHHLGKGRKPCWGKSMTKRKQQKFRSNLKFIGRMEKKREKGKGSRNKEERKSLHQETI